jgi:hypothetical protein
MYRRINNLSSSRTWNTAATVEGKQALMRVLVSAETSAPLFGLKRRSYGCPIRRKADLHVYSVTPGYSLVAAL